MNNSGLPRSARDPRRDRHEFVSLWPLRRGVEGIARTQGGSG
jgi:hypothetical protein